MRITLKIGTGQTDKVTKLEHLGFPCLRSIKIMNNEKVLDDMENRKTDKSNLESDTAPSRPKMLTEKEIARMNPKEARKRMKEIEEYMRSSVKK